MQEDQVTSVVSRASSAVCMRLCSQVLVEGLVIAAHRTVWGGLRSWVVMKLVVGDRLLAQARRGHLERWAEASVHAARALKIYEVGGERHNQHRSAVHEGHSNLAIEGDQQMVGQSIQYRS